MLWLEHALRPWRGCVHDLHSFLPASKKRPSRRGPPSPGAAAEAPLLGGVQEAASPPRSAQHQRSEEQVPGYSETSDVSASLASHTQLDIPLGPAR